MVFVSNDGFVTQCLCLQRAGTISPSFIASVLDSEPSLSAEHDADVKYTANSMYAASADTVRTDRNHENVEVIHYIFNSDYRISFTPHPGYDVLSSSLSEGQRRNCSGDWN